MKRHVFLFLLLPFIFAGSCKDDVEFKSEAISAIPMRSAFVVRINNLHELSEDLNKSIPGEAVKSSILFANLHEFVGLLDQHRTNKDAAISAFGAYNQYGAKSFGWMWCAEENQLPFLSKTLLSASGNVTSRAYSTTEIHHFTSENLDFYFAHQNGLVLLSKKENLVEESLKQLESGRDLTSDARFMETLNSTSSKDPVNVFVQYKSVPEWLESVLSEKAQWPANLATWSGFDLDINENDINFTGISLVPDTANTYIGLFKGTGTASNQFTRIIPENAALALSQTCGNIDAWHKNFEKYLGKENKLTTHNKQLAALGVNAEEWLAFTDSEIGVFYSGGALSATESKNAFVKILDIEMASQTLLKASGDFSESYRDITIKKLNARHALPLIYGKLFSYMGEPYWFSFGNWVIFCNDLTAAKSTINNLLSEKTWANLSAFEPVEKLRDSDAHLIAIARNPEWLNLAQKELLPDLAKDLSKNKKSIEAVNWALVQIKQNSDAAYSELVLLHQEETEVTAKQYWSVDLDGLASIRPQLVRNHRNNQNEVVVQDAAHNLYLIDAKGKVLWKKGLDGPILGEISQLDMYKNNKLQLAFNTAQRFYLVDRNGNDVENFPVKLPETATAAMAVLDYENTRNYRCIIPCGKQLYNYGVDGKQVKGWDFKKAKANLIAQPKHAVIGSKDFIYTVDAEGKVYVLNRRGEIREPIKNRLNNLASGIYLVGDKVEGGKLSALGKSGYVISLLLKDQIDSLQPYSQEPRFMTVNGKTTLIGAKNEVYKRSEAGNFDIDLDEEIVAEPRMYTVGNASYYAVATAQNQIWIFDAEGNAMPGMPLYGNGIATIGKTDGKEIHVIVATKEGSVIDYKLGE